MKFILRINISNLKLFMTWWMKWQQIKQKWNISFAKSTYEERNSIFIFFCKPYSQPRASHGPFIASTFFYCARLHFGARWSFFRGNTIFFPFCSYKVLIRINCFQNKMMPVFKYIENCQCLSHSTAHISRKFCINAQSDQTSMIQSVLFTVNLPNCFF